MSFLSEVTSQLSHISVCGIMTRSSVFSSHPALGRSSFLRVTSVFLGNTINSHSTRDCSMSSSSSTFASFIADDIVSLFGQALRQMPYRLLDDLILAVLVSPKILFSLPCCPCHIVCDFVLPRVHVLMSLVTGTDHLCTQLISDRDDRLPWIQLEQPCAPLPCAKYACSCVRATRARQHRDAIITWMTCATLFWLDTDGL